MLHLDIYHLSDLVTLLASDVAQTITSLNIIKVCLESISLCSLTSLKKLSLKCLVIPKSFRIDTDIISFEINDCEIKSSRRLPRTLKNVNMSRTIFSAHYLEGLTNLETLTLFEAVDITGNLCPIISTMYSLKELSVWGGYLERLEHLRTCTSIKHLKLSYISIDSLSFIDGWDLLSFESYSCRIKDISKLKHMFNLKKLVLYADDRKHTKRTKLDLSVIGAKLHLKELGIRRAGIKDINDLNLSTSLKYLNLSDNYIVDTSPLIKLQNLVNLSLSNNRIYDITPLTKLKLDALDISDNCVMIVPQTLVGVTVSGNYIVDGETIRNNVKVDAKYTLLGWVSDKRCRNAYKIILSYLKKHYPSKKGHDFSKLSERSRKLVYAMTINEKYSEMLDIVWPMVMDHEYSGTMIEIIDEEIRTALCHSARYYMFISTVASFYGLMLPLDYKILLDNAIYKSFSGKDYFLSPADRYKTLKPVFDETYNNYRRMMVMYA